ncbi:hypothetical protein UY3_11101 [Chelonia mydas]|uniref:Uncharacterized protein n=1 Tax=Chelonia mydas TaxID=8469 RepID=M7B1L6_CHEMY|nr:hypothetical protein UY3_11101 [Chelonia mydas]
MSNTSRRTPVTEQRAQAVGQSGTVIEASAFGLSASCKGAHICSVQGERCRLVEWASLRTDDATPSAESTRGTGVGASADSMKRAQNQMPLSFLVRGLKDLQILQRSLT